MESKLEEGVKRVDAIFLSPNDKKGCWESGRTKQYLATIIVNLLAFGFGMAIGWPAPVQETLQSAESPLGRRLDDDEFSWLASLTFIGGIFGTLFWGRAGDAWGRKRAALSVAAPYILGWATAFLAPTPLCLYGARMSLGFAGSGTFIIVPIYVGEIADDSSRGALGSYILLFTNAGIVSSYALGSVLSYSNFILISLLPPIIFLFLFWWFPETPPYLWLKNRREESLKSLEWFRGGDAVLVREECERYSKTLKKNEPLSVTTLYSHRGYRRAMTIIFGLFFVQQYCGIFVILSYTVKIFEYSGSSIGPKLATISVGLFQLAASYLSSVSIDRLGRKLLLLISYGLMCLSLVVLGIYFFFLGTNREESSYYSWVPVVFLCTHVFGYALAAGPVPFVIISEILPSKLRGMATSTAVLWGTSLVFVTIKLFPFFLNSLGYSGSFWFFGACCAFGFVFTTIYVPETKGRPLQEILAELNGDPDNLLSKEDTTNHFLKQ